MRRARNLTLLAVGVVITLAGIAWVFGEPLLARVFGISFDRGSGGEASLMLPPGYEAAVFAAGLDGPRFMAVSPDGVLFVAERGADRIVALPDLDGDGTGDEVVEVGAGYGRAHDIEFSDDGSLLVAGEETLYRVTLRGRTDVGREVLLGELPAGGHAAKTVEILPTGEILLSIGSSCDVCVERDARRAAVSNISRDGGRARRFMSGLRNAVGLWVDDDTGRAWATNMGRDRLGDDRPPETLYELVDGADAGWPRCHAGTQRDPEFGAGDDACAGVAAPASIFPAHMAPLALVGWDDHLVIAFHGSWNSSSKVGYALWWLPWRGEPAGPAEPFATGFLPDGEANARGRPAGLAVGSDGALYVSDDKAGFIYRVTRTDEGGSG